MNSLIQLKQTTSAFLFAFGFACFELAPTVQAVLTSPTPTPVSAKTAKGNAVSRNTTGGNTTSGADALHNNIASNNTADGVEALYSNNTGGWNTANGYQALFKNTTGGGNTASGAQALFSNTTGNSNTADGINALFNNTAGRNNIAIGTEAGQNLTTGSNNIDIGNTGVAGEANTTRIGTQATFQGQTKTFIAGISGTAVTGSAVNINSDGQLGVAASSERFKEAIKPMDKASQAILELKPVTFRYKHELDPDSIPQFGLVAEEVEKVNPALVTRDAQGKVFTVRYDAVNAMLLNEFLKQHRIVQDQQKEIDALKAELREQKALIQKVSARLKASKSTAQIVENNQ